MDLTAYVMRVLHIVGAAGFVGGALFAVVSLLPASKKVDKEKRGEFLFAAQRRSYRVLHPSMILLLISGLYQYATSIETYSDVGPRMHMVLGLKILVALVAFFILGAQTARLLKDKQGRWWGLMALLGLIVIVLASYARQVRLEAVIGAG